MKTDDLITMLATASGAVDSRRGARALASALTCGALASLLLMHFVLGVRSDLASAIDSPFFWNKLIFVAALWAAALFAVQRLGRPGARLAWLPACVAAPLALLALLALVVLANAAPEARDELIFGKTWKSCALLIAMLSLPVFIALGVALKDFAPTRLRLAGAAAGLLAGATGALVYCMHCPEFAPPFIALWYVAGIALPTALGAAFGERLLRW
jgi:hypothetical protein